MNRIYRLVWNRALRVLQVASELVHGASGGGAGNGGICRPAQRPLVRACAAAWLLAAGPSWATTTQSSQTTVSDGESASFSDYAFTGLSADLGGAIYNAGTIESITGSTFSANSASTAGGAIFNGNDGTIDSISDSTFSGNSAALGGAIVNYGMIESIEDSTFSGNSAVFGGAIYNSGMLTITDSTFSGNTVSSDETYTTLLGISANGGAIFNYGGTINLTVSAGGISTFSGNTADGLASSIYTYISGTLNVSIGAGGVLDMRDPMSGYATGHIAITQTGTGTWKLGGSNVFSSSDDGYTTFDVEGGTLYLYADGEVEDDVASTTAVETVAAGTIELDGSSSVFTLGSDATLVAAGDNSITTEGTIVLKDGATIRGGTAKDAADYDDGDARITTGGATSLTLSADGGVQLEGTLNVEAVTSDDTFTLDADLIDADGYTGSLEIEGKGTVVLTGTNTYSGGTTIDDGATLAISSDTNLGASTGTLTFAGGTLETTADITSSRAIILDSAGGTIDTDGNSDTFSGVISGEGSLTVASSTSGGTLTLTADNEYTGTTTINEGATLALSGSGSIADSSGVVDNGTFDISDTDSGTSITTLSGSGSVELGSKTLTLTAASGTFSGVISGDEGSLTISGGTEILTGDNDYGGGTIIDTGATLQLGDGGTSGSITGDVTDDGALVFDRSDDVSFDGAISGSGSVTVAGTGTLTLSGSNTYTGATTIDSGAGLILLADGEDNTFSSRVTDNGSYTLETADDGTLTISGLTGADEGGAIYVASGAKLSIDGSDGAVTFSDNSATYGGAIYNDGTATIIGTTFSSNSATYGGAILNYATIDSIEDSTFSSNAASHGGAIYNYSTIDSITGSSFSGNSASGYGGAIYNYGTIDSITGSSFSGNSASGYGGAIYNYDTITSITDSTFSSNTASYGGAIYNYDTIDSITGSSFSGNTATYSGGAIYNGGAITSIEDSAFSSNSASYGGAILNTGTLSISGSDFTDNTATYYGGAIYNTGTLSISGSDFTDNTATYYGGAIYNTGTLSITGSDFTGNTATYYGGAIFNTGTLSISDSTFSGNSAIYGGAIFNYGGTLTITDSTFSGNTVISDTDITDEVGISASGAAIVNSAGTLNLTVSAGGTSTFSGNTADGVASSIYTDGSGTLNVSIGAGGVLDMRDPMSGEADDGTIAITQTGTGTWKLGGSNVFSSSDDGYTTFDVEGGTLYLYAAGEVEDDVASTTDVVETVAAGTIELDGSSSVFTLGSDATLVAAGANSITTEGTIVLGNGATIRGGTAADATDDTLATFTPGGATSLTLSADGGVLLEGTLNLEAVTSADTFTLDADLVDADDSTAGSLNIEGEGTVVLTGDSSYTGGTTIQSGATLQLGDGGTTGSITGDVTDNGSLVFDRSDDVSFDGTISGSGSVTVAGTGTLTLTADNSYTGGTTIDDGATLSISSDTNLGDSSGTLTFAGGTLETTADITSSRAITLDSAGGTIDTDGYSDTFSGVISGTGALTVTGSGTLTLTADNTYTGTTTVDTDATLDLTGSIAGDLANAGSTDVDGGTVSGTTTNTGTLTAEDATLADLDNSGTATLTDSSADAVTNASGATFSATGGTLASLSNSGTATLGADNTVTGDVTSTAGSLTLDGNTIDGTLSVTGGSFAVTSSGSTAGSLTGSADGTLDGTLTLTAASGTYSGALSGDGGLVLSTDGSYTLSGDSTYSGGTSLLSGTLAVGSDTALGTGTLAMSEGTTLSFAADGLTLANAITVSGDPTIEVDDGDTATLSGVISDGSEAGEVVKSGAGTLILTADNTYTGGTEVAEGTLQLGNGGTSGSIVGDVAIDSGATLAVDRSDTYTYAGTISGSGSLLQEGSGTLVLSGDSCDFTGTSTVAAGILEVDGCLGGSTTVSSGGTLSGSGTVGDLTVSSGGTVSPGGEGTIATLTVDGDLVMESGSSYVVDVDAAGESDLLYVTGTATLNGGSVLSIAADGTWNYKTTYTILTALGGVSGTFDSVSSNFAFLTPTLSYDADDVYLTLVRNDISFASVGTTSNQKQTGAALESLATGAVFDAVVQLDSTDARQAFDQLSGEIHASVRSALLQDSRYVRDAIGQHLAGEDRGLAVRSDDGSAWASAWGHRGVLDGDGNAARLSFDGSGVLVGSDRRLSEESNAVLGVVAGQEQLSAEAAARRSDAQVRGTHLGLYAGTESGGWQLRGGLADTLLTVRTHRSVDIDSFSDRLNARYGANLLQAFAEGSYRFELAHGRLEPYLGLAHVRLRSDGYTEEGGEAALVGQGGRDDFELATLGVRGRWTLDAAGRVAAQATLGYQQAWGDLDPTLSQRFAAGGDSFQVAGVPLARRTGLADLGLRFQLTGKANLQAGYSGQFGGGSRDQGAKLALDVVF
ncbi:MAG: autotransporter-associated beta strand repeat-containing protein [Pseudoxanthomonas sp.]